jgi:hypothetical protein
MGSHRIRRGVHPQREPQLPEARARRRTMSERNDGGFAFPVNTSNECNAGAYEPDPGMSLRQYAAIKLRVPDSGVDWLDAMIERANRDHFAGQALMGDMASQSVGTGEWGNTARCEILFDRAKLFYRYADAMIAARKEAQP